MVETFDNLTPYNYGVNNPILMIDPTGIAAVTVKLQEVSILKDAPKRNPVQGLWQNAVYAFNGGNYDGYQYHRQGNPLGPSPNTGIPPDFSLAKPVKILEVEWNLQMIFKLGSKILPEVKVLGVGKVVVSNVWVITDPIYKMNALKVLSK
jgi:hypothetical protein